MIDVIFKRLCPFIGCVFRGTQSAVDAHKSSCSCSSELHIQTVTMAEVMCYCVVFNVVFNTIYVVCLFSLNI